METWRQSRHTKLGYATIEIVQVQDLYEAKVSFVNEGIDLIFQAVETFGDTRCAKMWAYGLKQSINDDYAGYSREYDTLIETRPAKGKIAITLPILTVIQNVIFDYDNFELGKTASSKGDTISVSQVKASTLSPEDQATLLALMAKAKGTVSNG